MAGTAQTWVATGFGGLDVFEERELDVPDPGPGEVTIAVRAAGMNPADYKHVARRGDPAALPIAVGYEISGVVTAIGPDTVIGSGAVTVGDEVVAFRISGGYSSARTVRASDVFAKPPTLPFDQAAGLLLAGCTASEMLHVTAARAGETVLVHGASGAVGVSVLQQAALAGVRVIGTASAANAEVVRRFGGVAVEYGEGLADRVRALAPEGIAAALDCVGTDEAVDVSLELVPDPDRIVTIAAMARVAAAPPGDPAARIRVIAGAIPASTAYRDSVRAHLLDLAGRGDLVVPIARTFPLGEAREAMALLKEQHPGGKLILLP
ncbi:NADP-dependent oxidoreductase [Herbiconiux moechotypicola]|uniref:NADP-dependent oxidoreductase n=1 Tax=Herbiconiux moechotypicola TaxID=637393 RepID=A0ABP5Q7G0_9MICO|nr:NADP-dependent oxidoreductase [Herbiconiux moechotypicola]MCS5729161.1 NADP-dependent oxidoreductase [Herbiconiux moechotypicola]